MSTERRDFHAVRELREATEHLTRALMFARGEVARDIKYMMDEVGFIMASIND